MPRGEKPAHTPVSELAAALSHPDRIWILMAMNAPIRRLSPSDYSEEAGLVLGSSSYHFRVLKSAGCIEVVDEKRNRGAVEHIYEPVRRALAWKREYEELPDIAKQNIDAVSLRGYVEAVGDAVDAGTFGKREGSHIAYDRF